MCSMCSTLWWLTAWIRCSKLGNENFDGNPIVFSIMQLSYWNILWKNNKNLPIPWEYAANYSQTTDKITKILQTTTIQNGLMQNTE